METFTLRPEQRITIDKTKEVLLRYNLVYLAAEPRCGKSIMSLTAAKELGWKKVGVFTKKKAIASIESDHQKSGYGLTLIVRNYERATEIPTDCDGYIIDEAHSIGAFPKPSKRTKDVKSVIGKKQVILMSGTPSPECLSQIFHQFWISHYTPFVYPNFYRWSDDYVNVKKKFINGMQFADYSQAKEEKIKEVTKHYMVTLSQKEAGFTTQVDEEILTVPMNENMYRLMDVLKRDRVYTMKNGDVILADTPVKLQTLFHQISSGTVIAEKNSYVLDPSKGDFIRQRFAGQKIAIFYKFKKELELLMQLFPDNTSSPEEFNASSNKTFFAQFVSGREGVNLSTADALVAFNIDFSATTYFQFKERAQTKDRKTNSKLYWIFSDQGIEEKVYKVVGKKLPYTKRYFMKDYGIKA